ncbi:MAG: peptidylprolyl isomerase [Christensenellaceae bacterium]|jgi:peptidyl-prolyl cis-trans isomerase B (cyclophilin B)|nr:peptidylprolyl isomerase [Christensenellaceae bacterium]
MVVIEMENGGVIELELDASAAPNTVQNFKYLAEQGFYNGLLFHRVISGFMIQGGCPEGTGMGGPGYGIRGEFAQNGVANPLKHTRGVISMARAASPNSAGSQFFIMHQDGNFLDGQYAAFGKVVSGLEVVDAIAAAKTDGADRPLTDVRIKSITLVNEAPAQKPQTV